MVPQHAPTQRPLCERFAVPVIGAVTCQDITPGHMQQVVNAAPTSGEGDRVQGMISALVGAGLEGGNLQPPAGQGALAGRRPPAARVIVVDRKVIEVAGHIYLEAPKNRKCRRTIYPRRTPAEYPLAGGCAGEMRGDERTGRL